MKTLEITFNDCMRYGDYYRVTRAGREIFIFEPDKDLRYELKRLEMSNETLFATALIEQVKRFKMADTKLKEPNNISTAWKK